MKLRFPFAALLLAGTAFGVAAVHPPRAWAQVDSREAISLQDQIAELRQELQIMQQNQQNAGQAPAPMPPPDAQAQPPGQPPANGDLVASLLVRVSALEEQNRALQGRVDDLTNQLQRQNDTLGKQIGDLAFKLGQGPAAAGAPPPGSGEQAAPGGEGGGPPPEAAPDSHREAPPPHRPPELALREGNVALARRDYPAAAAAAHEVLASGHGTHTADAELLLARAEGGMRQYHEAANDFYQAFRHAPKSPNAPIALLGVANAFIGENRNADACKALALLAAQFPQPSNLIKVNAASARRRAGCAR